MTPEKFANIVIGSAALYQSPFFKAWYADIMRVFAEAIAEEREAYAKLVRAVICLQCGGTNHPHCTQLLESAASAIQAGTE